MTWDTFLTLRGTKGIYLDHVGILRPSKSYVWEGGGGVVVAHKILETVKVLGLLWDSDFGLGLVNI